MHNQTTMPNEFMRMRVEALYTHNAQSRLTAVNQWDGGVAPRFYLGRSPNGNICRFHKDLPKGLVEELRDLCADEPPLNQPIEAPIYADEYIRLLSDHAPVERIWSGPAYLIEPANLVETAYPVAAYPVAAYPVAAYPVAAYPVAAYPVAAYPSETDVVRQSALVAITAENIELLRGGLDAWIPDVPHRQPLIAIVEDGAENGVEDGYAVAICASVRITKAAHEAGVETLPAYRRRGHAVNAVAAWARAVRSLGAIPFYSTSWDNVASQSVAARLGLSIIGTDFSIT